MKQSKKVEQEVEYEILGEYDQGWEVVDTASSVQEAQLSLKLYRENEPEYHHTMRKRRAKQHSKG